MGHLPKKATGNHFGNSLSQANMAENYKVKAMVLEGGTLRPEDTLPKTVTEEEQGNAATTSKLNDEFNPKPSGRLSSDDARKERVILSCGRGNKKKRKDGEIRIGTWNVRTMNKSGKLENVKEEMKRSGLNILGISEVRWKEGGDFISDGFRIIYAGGEESQRGVAIILDNQVSKSVTDIERYGDRFICVRIRAEPVDLVVIQVYMPTSVHSEEEIETMYDQIEEVLDRQKGTDCMVIMGDWNAVVGEGSEGKVVGKYGLGNRNESGAKLIDFCKRRQLVITNTWFEQEKRRRYTWKSPGDRARYQIDYIMVKQRYRNGVKGSKSYPGADVYSDHNLVAMRMKIKLKKIGNNKRQKKWDLERFEKTKELFQNDIEKKLGEERTGMAVEERWKRLKDAVLESAQNNVGWKRGKTAKKPLITTGMLEKMRERREWKNINTEEGKRTYRKLNNELKRETQKAKDTWWENECQQLEQLCERGRSDLMYKKVKQLTKKGSNNNRTVSIKDSNGNLVNDLVEVRNRWREYVEMLYDKSGKPEAQDMGIEEEHRIGIDEKGPDLLESEILQALKDMKTGKAVGVDEVPAEFLKVLGEKGEKELVTLCKEMYIEGKWPEDFTRVVMIPLPKKANAVECSDHRTISLISHASKIMLKVLTKRIEAKAKDLIGRNQFGFRRGCGTRDAIGVMRVLCERTMEHGNDVYICFVDFEKAFDRVSWEKMMKVLQNLGVDWRDRKMISELYLNQEAVIRVGDEESEPAIIGRGVRQGCPLSPLLFSIYAEVMMAEALDTIEEGVRVGGELVKDVRFADDQGMVASSEAGLQRMMESLNETCKRYDMKINVNKTNSMVVAKTTGKVIDIRIEGQRIQQVKRFKYLGSLITEDGRSIEDVKARIGMAKVAFGNRKELLSRRMRKTVKKQMIKTLIWPVALYGCETWTLRKEEIDRLEAFEMWLWRRMERVSWVDKITNVRMLEEIDEKRSLIESIVKRKKNWAGHVLRGEGLLKLVIEERIEGKRTVGRPRMGMLDDLKEGSYEKMKRRADHREVWRNWKPRTCRKVEN